MLLKLGTSTFYTASISPTTWCYFSFASVCPTSGTCGYSDTWLIPMLYLYRLGARPTGGGAIPLPRRSMAEGRLHNREVFFAKSENLLFAIPKTYKLLQAPWQSRIMYRMESSRRMHTPAGGGGRGNKSHGTFNTALRMAETTPISHCWSLNGTNCRTLPTYVTLHEKAQR